MQNTYTVLYSRTALQETMATRRAALELRAPAWITAAPQATQGALI